MTEYILDTDHVTAFQHGNPRFLQRMKLVDSSQIFVTIITLEEQIKGRFKVINNHNTDFQKLPLAYYEFRKTFDFFIKMNLLDFDHRALTHYQNLKKQKDINSSKPHFTIDLDVVYPFLIKCYFSRYCSTKADIHTT